MNGSKMWISGVDKADWGVPYARTGEGGQRAGIAAFIIDPKRAGMSCKKIGLMRSCQPFEIHFDNYDVPAEDRLGEESVGFAIAQEWLVHARVPCAAASIGVAQASLDLAIEWAKQRETFGSLLADKQVIQWMLVDSEMDLRASRLLVYQAAWHGDMGKDIKTDASLDKVFATETAGGVVDRCMHADFRRHGHDARVAPGALVPRVAHSPRRRGSFGSPAHGDCPRYAAGSQQGVSDV